MSSEKLLDSLYNDLQKLPTNLKKNTFLIDLKNKDLNLFLKFARQYLTTILPLIYTPTVGEAVLHYRHYCRHPRALYLPYCKKNKIGQVLKEYPSNIDVIVVTDGERILGLGDQGAPGIEIPVAKLLLYTLFGGINCENTLPIVLDAGTNNNELLKDKSYFGWRHKRINKKEYINFINQFIKAIKKRWPQALLQWEDFGRDNAMANLKKYRNKLCSFNDDIQGTAVVTLAALLSALKITRSKLSEQRIVIYGAGSAGIGIANMLTKIIEKDGYSSTKAKKQFWLIDKEGLLNTNSPHITADQKPFLRPYEELASWPAPTSCNRDDLYNVVRNVKPTILIGTSGASNAFNAKIIKEMAKHVIKPIILPLSNPNSKSEAKPEDLIKWTDGKALIATGSPFPPVSYQGKIYPIAQCNNVFSFPGLGRGILESKIKVITDDVLILAAETIFSYHQKHSGKNESLSLLPKIEDAQKIAKKISLAIKKYSLRTK